MNALARSYYHLTAHLPRKLPRTPQEFKALRQIMIQAYGCNDQPSTTMVMAGQVTSTEAHKVRKSYAHIANCIKRLEINAVAAEFRQLAIQENNARLESATKKAVEAFQSEESHDQTSEIISEAHGQPEPARAPIHGGAEPTQATIPDLL